MSDTEENRPLRPRTGAEWKGRQGGEGTSTPVADARISAADARISDTDDRSSAADARISDTDDRSSAADARRSAAAPGSGRDDGTRTALLLRLEGGVALAAGVAAFHVLSGPWLWFVLLFLVPDLFMLGYVRGPRAGAAVYNFAHTYLFPAGLVLIWLFAPETWILWIAALWTAHIGLDRMLGFGLKDPAGFNKTHLQRV